MSAVEARIAAALAEHHVVYGPFGAECRFGDWHEEPDCDDWAAEFARHQASVVAALPDIAIVPVVEPTDTKDYSEGGEGEDYLGWEVQEGPYFVSVYDQGEVQVSYDGNVGEPISVDYAHDLGTALIAAARAAGGQQ